MNDRAKGILKLVVRFAVTVGLLFWVFRQVDLTQLRQAAGGTRWLYVVMAWGCTLTFFTVQSIAMRLILRKQGCDVRISTLLCASCATALYGLVLPGILSTGIKWYILRRHTGKGSHVLSSMLYNQMMLSVAMMAIGLVGLMVVNPTRVLLPDSVHQWILPVVCVLVLSLVVGLCALLLGPRTGRAVTGFLGMLLKPWPQRFRNKGHDVLSQIATFQTAGWKFHLVIASINIFDGLVVGSLIYFMAALAAHVTVDFGVLVWLWAIIFVLGKVPISIANIGVREATVITFLAAYGVERSSALLMSMVLFSTHLFLAGLGALYQLFGTGPHQTEDI